MLFNSFEFFVFLAILVPVYFALDTRTRQQGALLCASFVFYAAWSLPFTTLLVGSALFAWAVALRASRAGRASRSRCWIALGVIGLLAVLGYFKYYNFFIDSLRLVWPEAGSAASIILPMGISFYTFQAISYVVDVRRGLIRAEPNPARVVLYISFFPQLVAGPIVRAQDFMPQLNRPRARFNWDDTVWGARRILIGLLKKVVVADNLASIVDPVYAAPDAFSGPMLLLATYAFALQIYCDFSAYSDIAIGVARIFGYRLNENFDAPYRSQGIQEFWRRWHISLSRWLRDYLYIPLGGNRGGTLATYRNLLITMILGGLWHGASFNFILWGLLHGSWLAAERALQSLRARAASAVPMFVAGPGAGAGAGSGSGSGAGFGAGAGRGYGAGAKDRTGVGAIGPVEHPAHEPAAPSPVPWRWVKRFLVFHGVCLTWIVFRTTTLEEAWSVIVGIASMQSGTWLAPLDLALQGLMAMVSLAWLWSAARLGEHSWLWYPLGAVAILIMLVFGVSSNEFIYFVF